MRDTGHGKDMLAFALLLSGRISTHQGHLGQAISMLEQSLTLFREVGFKDGIALVLSGLGDAKRVLGNLGQSRALLTEGLLAAREIGHRAGIGRNLIGLANVAADSGQVQQATRLLAAAASWVNPGVEFDPMERAAYERVLGDARAHLDESAFAAAWDEGCTRTLDEVLSAPAPASPGKPSPLQGGKLVRPPLT
jgi:hypothetical protein